MNLDDYNYLPDEELENICAYCDTPCNDKYCSSKCFENDLNE